MNSKKTGTSIMVAGDSYWMWAARVLKRIAFKEKLIPSCTGPLSIEKLVQLQPLNGMAAAIAVG